MIVMNLVVIAFVLALPPAPSDAEAFVRGLLAPYATSGKIERNDADIYDPTLLALITKEREIAAGEVGALDADPICNCQDWGKLSITSVKAEPPKNDRTAVRAQFVNLGHKQTSVFTLVTTPSGPRVWDVNLGKALPSVRKIVADFVKEYGSAKP